MGVSFQDYSESITAKLHIGRAKKAAIVGVCVLLFIAAVVAVTSIVATGNGFEVSKASASDVQAEEMRDDSSATEASASDICVDVAGCVNKPGICYLPEGSRVADAIEAAEGFSETAAKTSVNQARVLTDGEQLYVPSIDEQVPSMTAMGSEPGGASSASSGKVNINTADSDQLQTISGIGQSKADKIIAYRNANGPFSSVDELTNVSGIGEKTLESIRDSICV